MRCVIEDVENGLQEYQESRIVYKRGMLNKAIHIQNIKNRKREKVSIGNTGK